MMSIHDRWVFTWRESRKKPAPVVQTPDTLNKSIETLDLSMRCHNVLMKNKIDTIEKVISNLNRIPKLKGIGWKSVEEIEKKIAPYKRG